MTLQQPKITEEEIADEKEVIFEVVADEDSSRTADDVEDEDDPFAEDDRRDLENLRRQGYKIQSDGWRNI